MENQNSIVVTLSALLKNRRIFLILLLVIVVSLFTLVYFRIVKNPLQNVPLLQKGPKVSIKTEYKNPFKKETQYVNPFETYKNPFTIAK